MMGLIFAFLLGLVSDAMWVLWILWSNQGKATLASVATLGTIMCGVVAPSYWIQGLYSYFAAYTLGALIGTWIIVRTRANAQEN